MACPQPYATSERASVAAESAHRDTEKQKAIARVVKLHDDGLTNAQIMARLGLTRPTVVKYLREGGRDGYSAKQGADGEPVAESSVAVHASLAPADASPPMDEPVSMYRAGGRGGFLLGKGE